MLDSLGDRIKAYEGQESLRKLLGLAPVVARIDGIGFHNFTKGLERPYDKNLSDLMIETTKYLIQEFGANCAYTQSDEISLGWYLPDNNQEIYGGYRVQKLVSHLASKTTARFNKLLPTYLPAKAKKEAYFDSRVFSLPNLTEATNVFVWREQDATRNSIEGAARAYYSHKECFKQNCSKLQDMLFLKGVNWAKYPSFFKRGTFITKKQVSKKFTTEELTKLPEKHEARKTPDLVFKRTEWKIWEELPKITSIKNRERFLFYGEDPVLEEHGI